MPRWGTSESTPVILLPVAFLDTKTRLSGCERAVIDYLCWRIPTPDPRSTTPASIAISMQALADAIGYSKRAVIAAVHHLEALRYIKHDPGTRHCPSWFRLMVPRPAGVPMTRFVTVSTERDGVLSGCADQAGIRSQAPQMATFLIATARDFPIPVAMPAKQAAFEPSPLIQQPPMAAYPGSHAVITERIAAFTEALPVAALKLTVGDPETAEKIDSQPSGQQEHVPVRPRLAAAAEHEESEFVNVSESPTSSSEQTTAAPPEAKPAQPPDQGIKDRITIELQRIFGRRPLPWARDAFIQTCGVTPNRVLDILKRANGSYHPDFLGELAYQIRSRRIQ